MDMELRPIIPKRKIVDADRVHRALSDEMYRFVAKFSDILQTYPPDIPSGYRRSLALAASWKHEVQTRPDLIVGIVGSDPSVLTGTIHHRRLKGGGKGKGYLPKKAYARYVMGKKQARLMKSRGWRKVGDILKKEWPGQVRRFRQVINAAK